ncbi:hypothetical protein DL96DRAFT_1722692 [Flagelloscypha sp. PMI_526]|nr:hypothetical protein DL96DRAFT_1722692 [Flagelloscypha sp. PMI_526]
MTGWNLCISFLVVIFAFFWKFLPSLVTDFHDFESEWQWARKIDIVYTWVNGSDPNWLALRAEKCQTCSLEATCHDRSHDELRYSLRSLEMYMPWHEGKVFIISPGQTPNWLNLARPNLNVINTEDLIQNSSSNSFLTEWYYDKIPGLSEHFVAFSDDFFIDSPVHPSTLFTLDGAARFFDNAHFSEATVRIINSTRLEADSAYDKYVTGYDASVSRVDLARMHTSASFKEVFQDNRAHYIFPKHAPQVFRRSIYPGARMMFANYIEPMQTHHRRHPRSLMPLETLREYAIRLSAMPGEAPVAVVAPREECKARYMTELVGDDIQRNARLFNSLLHEERERYTFFSLNDAMDQNWEVASGQLRAFMEERWPVPSSFELH